MQAPLESRANRVQQGWWWCHHGACGTEISMWNDSLHVVELDVCVKIHLPICWVPRNRDTEPGCVRVLARDRAGLELWHLA